jgi:hypothetical protein
MMQQLVPLLCAILIVAAPAVGLIRPNCDWRTCGPIRDEHLHGDVPASETPRTALQHQIGRAQANAQPAARTVHVRHRISFAFGKPGRRRSSPDRRRQPGPPLPSTP